MRRAYNQALPAVSRVRLYELALLYCAAIWGSTFYIVKDTLTDVHPLALVGWRFTTAGLMLLPLVWLRSKQSAGVGRAYMRASGGHIWPPYELRAGMVLGAVLWALYAAQTYGLLYTTAANSAFITGLFIIFVPPLSYLLHRAIPASHQLIAVAIAVGGLYLLTGGPAGLNRGDLLTLIAAATYALQVLLAGRYMQRGADAVALAAWQMLACGVLSLFSAVVIGAPLGIGSTHALWLVAFLTLLPTLSAYWLQLLAQGRVDPLRTALIFTMEPVFGALFAWTLGGEAFVPLRAIGGLLIVAAMLVADAALWQLITRR